MIVIRTATGKRYSGDGLLDLIRKLEDDGVRDQEALEVVTVTTTLDAMREAQGRTVTLRGNVTDMLEDDGASH